MCSAQKASGSYVNLPSATFRRSISSYSVESIGISIRMGITRPRIYGDTQQDFGRQHSENPAESLGRIGPHPVHDLGVEEIHHLPRQPLLYVDPSNGSDVHD